MLHFLDINDMGSGGYPGILSGPSSQGVSNSDLTVPPENNTDTDIDTIDPTQTGSYWRWQQYQDSMKTPQASNSSQEDSGFFDSGYQGQIGEGEGNNTGGVVNTEWFYNQILNAIKEQQLFNQNSANQAMEFEHQEANLNRQWQKMMSDTSYQRAVEDMKKAGLNPTLIGLGTLQSASTPSGSSASGHQASMSSASGSFNGLMDSIINNYKVIELTKDIIIDFAKVFNGLIDALMPF